MALRRTVVKNYPVVAYIDPTLFCNLRCPACPTGLRLGLRPAASIKWDMYRSIIDEIGDYLFVLNMFNWGEPLLHKQTPELIRYAKAKGIEVTLSTNLSLNLTDAYIERLVRSGLDTLTVSVDGATEETYKRYRRGGDYSLVRTNMLRIQSARARLRLDTPKIVWQFLVFRHNQHEIDVVRAQYEAWGADLLLIAGAHMPFEPYDEGFEPSSIPEYNLYDPGHPYQILGRRQLAGGRPCSWLYGGFALNPNGKVSPCCACAAEKDDFGEYSPCRGFFDVWNSYRFKKARRLFLERGRGRGNQALGDLEPTRIAQRLAGTGGELQAPLKPGELICQKCPVPFVRDGVNATIALIAQRHASLLLAKRDIRYLLALLLMGGPAAGPILRGAVRKINRTVRLPLHRLFARTRLQQRV